MRVLLNRESVVGKSDYRVFAITLISASIILQLIYGILTIVSMTGFHLVCCGDLISENKVKRKRGKVLLFMNMLLAFLISMINYFIAAFIQ
jgi:hypothetical protein